MSCQTPHEGETALIDLPGELLHLSIGRDWRSTSLVNRQLLTLVRQRTPVSLILSGEQGTLLQQLPPHRAWRNCRSLRYNHNFGWRTEGLEAVATTLEHGAEHWPQLQQVHLAGVGCRCSSSATLWRRAAAALQRCPQLQQVTLDRCLIDIGVLPAIPQLRKLLLDTFAFLPEELQQPEEAEARRTLTQVADLTPLRHLRALKDLQVFNLVPQVCDSPAAEGGEGGGAAAGAATAAAAAGGAAAAVEGEGAASEDCEGPPSPTTTAAAAAHGGGSQLATSTAAGPAEGGGGACGAAGGMTAPGAAAGCLPSTLEHLQLCVESIIRWVPHLADASCLTSLHISYTTFPGWRPRCQCTEVAALASAAPPQLQCLTLTMEKGYRLQPSEAWQGLSTLTQLQLEGCWLDCMSSECWENLAAAFGGLKVLRGLLPSCAPPPELQLGALEVLTMNAGHLSPADIPAVLSACPELRSVVVASCGPDRLQPTAQVAPTPWACTQLEQLELLLLPPAAACALVKAAPAGLRRLKVHLPGDVWDKVVTSVTRWDFSHLTALTRLEFTNWGLQQQLQAAATARRIRSLQLCLLYPQPYGEQRLLTLAQLQELCGVLPDLEEVSCCGSEAQAAKCAQQLAPLVAQPPLGQKVCMVSSGRCQV